MTPTAVAVTASVAKAERVGKSDQPQQQQLTLHVNGRKSKIDPVIRAGDAALHRPNAEHRQRGARKIKRNDGRRVDVRHQQPHRDARRRRRRCVPNSNASQRLPLRNPRSRANCLCSVYSGMKRCAAEPSPKIDHAADQQHPGPGIDVDAEFEAAHPARQQDLRHEGDRRADHADDECCAGKAAHQRESLPSAKSA